MQKATFAMDKEPSKTTPATSATAPTSYMPMRTREDYYAALRAMPAGILDEMDRKGFSPYTPTTKSEKTKP